MYKTATAILLSYFGNHCPIRLIALGTIAPVAIPEITRRIITSTADISYLLPSNLGYLKTTAIRNSIHYSTILFSTNQRWYTVGKYR